jgi:hypothetical protein
MITSQMRSYQHRQRSCKLTAGIRERWSAYQQGIELKKSCHEHSRRTMLSLGARPYLFAALRAGFGATAPAAETRLKSPTPRHE